MSVKELFLRVSLHVINKEKKQLYFHLDPFFLIKFKIGILIDSSLAYYIET